MASHAVYTIHSQYCVHVCDGSHCFSWGALFVWSPNAASHQEACSAGRTHSGTAMVASCVPHIKILRRMPQEWSSIGMFLNWWRNEHLRGRRRAPPNHIVQPLGWEVWDLAQRPETRLILLVHELPYIGFLAVQLHEIDRCRTAFFGYRLQ